LPISWGLLVAVCKVPKPASCIPNKEALLMICRPDATLLFMLKPSMDVEQTESSLTSADLLFCGKVCRQDTDLHEEDGCNIEFFPIPKRLFQFRHVIPTLEIYIEKRLGQ